MVKILAVDPGYANVGVALYPSKELQHIFTEPNMPIKDRMEYVIENLHEVLLHERPDVLVVEDFHNFGRQKNTDTTLKIVGSLLGLGLAFGLKTVLVSPNAWITDLGLTKEHKRGTIELVEVRGWDLSDFTLTNRQHVADAAGLVEWYIQEEARGSSKQDT